MAHADLIDLIDLIDLVDLVGMGPSAHHIGPDELAGRVGGLPDPLAVTVSVTISAYRPA
jgi:23S rRNA (guanine745-N1)-methyltransferase